MTAPARRPRSAVDRARELAEAGVPLRELAKQLHVSVLAAERYLLRAGVQAVPERRKVVPSPQEVRPERAAVAFTAARGWHMTEAPPGWFLDLLAELD